MSQLSARNRILSHCNIRDISSSGRKPDDAHAEVLPHPLRGLFTGTAAREQFPDQFTNLKVLPKDTSKEDLQATMRGFAFALGVRCEYCHVEKKAPEKGFDFPADYLCSPSAHERCSLSPAPRVP